MNVSCHVWLRLLCIEGILGPCLWHIILKVKKGAVHVREFTLISHDFSILLCILQMGCVVSSVVLIPVHLGHFMLLKWGACRIVNS